MSKWNTTKLIATGSLGVLLLILQLIPAVINTFAPTRTFAGPYLAIVFSIMAMICLFIVNRFGSATLMFTVFGFLALPFNIFGTPGLFMKIPISIIGGLIIDFLYLLLKKRKLFASLIVPGPFNYYTAFAIVMVARFFDVPGLDLQSELLFSPIAVIFSFVAGAIGGFIGFLIYNKIKNTNVVKRIQGNNDQEHLHSKKIDNP